MYVPSAADLIGVWERGRTQNAVERALTLLAAGHPDATLEQLRELSIPQRDRRLFELHELLFGATLQAVAACERCAAQLEFTFDARVLRGGAEGSAAAPLELTDGDTLLRFRAPTSSDLLAALSAGDAAAVRRAIAERCVILAARKDAPVAPDELPDAIVARLADALSSLESASDVTLGVSCAECGHHSELPFDIAAFLWAEIQWLARNALEEVHSLAWAYGWSERDILAMSAARRAFYLERIL